MFYISTCIYYIFLIYNSVIFFFSLICKMTIELWSGKTYCLCWKKGTMRDCLRAKFLWDGARQSTTGWADLGSMDTGQRRLSACYSPMNQILLRAWSYSLFWVTILEEQKSTNKLDTSSFSCKIARREVQNFIFSCRVQDPGQRLWQGTPILQCHNKKHKVLFLIPRKVVSFLTWVT